MDSVVVLLVDCADKLEVANTVTLDLLGAEEANGSLGCNSGTRCDLAGSDKNETVTLGLPGEVDDGFLDAVDDLDGDALLSDAENLEVGGKTLLALAVPVDLDADEVGVRLPVELGVGDIEEVPGTDDLLGGNGHETDLSGVAAHFGGPVAEELLVGLDIGPLGGCGRPLEVHDSFDLDAGLVHKVHAGKFVDTHTLARVHACNVVGVGRPLECGPLQLLLNGLAFCVHGWARKIESDE